MYGTLTVARMDPAHADRVARIFADSDSTELPHLVGVSQRTPFAFHGLYFHLAQADRSFEPDLDKMRSHPLYHQINTRLARLLSPFHPAMRERKDALAVPFYTWTPDEGSQVTSLTAAGGAQ